jgi:hypothetical protein
MSSSISVKDDLAVVGLVIEKVCAY